MTDRTEGGLRPLDHLVLPTVSLEVARARFTALGFQVAPPGVHPFGTENACVYLSDGTFLEPLAITDPERTRQAAEDGNVFVARDRAYRALRGPEGFSAIVFTSFDAVADHDGFVREGFSGGSVLDFSREFRNLSGASGIASFRLAFASAKDAPDLFLFTCQRIASPNVDRSVLQRHPNGAAGLKSVVLTAGRPACFERLLSVVAGVEPVGTTAGAAVFELGKAKLELMDHAGLHHRFGSSSLPGAGLEARAIVFAVPNVETTRSFLLQNGIEARMRGKVLVVGPAAGQGALFAFEEA